MNNYFIILASGQSKRFNSTKPKQYIVYKNKPLFKHSVDKALESKLFRKIILVVNNKKQIKDKFPNNVILIKGGKERSDSSLIALKYIKKFKPKNVLVHDAARPNFSLKLLKNIIQLLKNNYAVIPTINSTDSIKYKVKMESIATTKPNDENPEKADTLSKALNKNSQDDDEEERSVEELTELKNDLVKAFDDAATKDEHKAIGILKVL